MIDAAVQERSEALVRTLLDSVRIASISLTGEGIPDQVGFLQKQLTAWGFQVEVHPTAVGVRVMRGLAAKHRHELGALYEVLRKIAPATTKPRGTPAAKSKSSRRR